MRVLVQRCDKANVKVDSNIVGLDGEEECTQREISAKLGISRSYVSRIEKKALIKLRKIVSG